MARKRDLRALGLGLLAVWASACGGQGPDADVETTHANLVTSNALSMNALSMNALSMNALVMPALSDPLARQFLKYAVSCALPADQSIDLTIDGAAYSFPGGLGLAPQWGQDGGTCDETCQRWVSGCMLARVDFLGVERPISVRGASPALQTSFSELRDYPVREATYYGNLWAPGAPKFACLAPGKKQDPRVCGDSLDNCPMDVVGNCAVACAYEGPTGGYVNCSSSGKARKPEIYHESVSVFLPRTGM
jgi:hypothetical protein